MGRRSGGGRSAGRAAPRRAASSAARRPPARSAPTAKPPARAAPKAAPPAKAAPAAAPPAQSGSAMGGFMANVASTAAGVAAGRAIDRTFFGGGGGGAHEAAGEVPVEGGSEYYDDNELPEVTDEMCSREVYEFKKCLARTGTDMEACKWNLDILMACQQQQASTGFADAGRF